MSNASVQSGDKTPITSQPGSNAGSQAGSEAGSTLDIKEDDGNIMLPTPRQFMTPQDCPPGLSALTECEYVFLKRSYHSIEAMGIQGFTESTVKYEALTVFGHRIFVVVEKSGAIMSKILCVGAQPFSLVVYGKSNETQFKKEALQLSGHPGSFGRGGHIEIKCSNKKLGKIEQESDFNKVRYAVSNAEGKSVLKIIGPKSANDGCCSMGLGNVLVHEFDVFLADGYTHVGRIAKHWSGVPNNREVFARSDIWGVKFHHEHDVKLKATLMCSIFLMIYQTPLTPPPPST